MILSTNSAGRNGGGIYSQLASTININGDATFINNSVGSRLVFFDPT